MCTRQLQVKTKYVHVYTKKHEICTRVSRVCTCMYHKGSKEVKYVPLDVHVYNTKYDRLVIYNDVATRMLCSTSLYVLQPAPTENPV